MYADGQILFTHEQLFQSSTVKSEKIRLFEAFSGYGSQSLALEMLGVDFEHVGIAEIDKYAIQAHRALHGDVKNYGDISKIETNDLPDMDLFTYSFPCQDISNAGKQRGLKKDSGTRSSLLWECEKVIDAKRPRFLMMENVKNLIGKKNKPHFDEWLSLLESYGYNNYWKVVNAKWCGIPQNRERVFCVSILKAFDDGSFHFEEDFDNGLRLKDMLEIEVDEKYYLNEEKTKGLISQLNKNIEFSTGVQLSNQAKNLNSISEIASCLLARDYKGFGNQEMTGVIVKEATKQGYAVATEGDSINLEHPNSTTRRGRVGVGVAQTLTTSCNQAVVEPNIKQVGNLIETESFGGNPQTGRVYDADGISPTLNTCGGGQREPKILAAAIRGRNPQNPTSRESGLPTVQMLETKTDGISNCLTTVQKDYLVVEDLRIRKLTPRECFRLMGLNDQQIDKIQAVGISNSQQYKLAGNSIVVHQMAFLKNLPGIKFKEE